MNYFSETNKFRIFLYHFYSNNYFNSFMILCILTSAVLLALDKPLLDPKSRTKKILYWLDFAFLIIFTLEAMVKCVVYGIIHNGVRSYLKQGWNQVDFGILIFTYLCLTPIGSSIKGVKAFKITKALRLISRNEGLKVAVRALIYAIPNVLRISLIMGMFYMIFGVINISYFKGKLFYCLSPHTDLISKLDTKWDCLDAGGSWVLRAYNWDNISNAAVTLFVMATTAGWGEMTIQTIIGRGVDLVPDSTLNRSTYWILYFTAFMLIGSIFFINLFVGVVQSTFRSEHDRVGGDRLLTEKQKEWIELKLLVLRSAPIAKVKAPENQFRLLCFKIEEHAFFERFVQICILLN